MAAAGVARAFVPAGSKPTLEAAGILAAKAAAVVFTVQIPAGSPGVSAAPAGNIGAVAAVPGAKTAAVSKLWAFGFVHHIGVNLIQKAGRRVAARLAENHTAAGGRKIQLFLGAGNTDIAQAALLFHFFLAVASKVTRENAILHTNDKHIREFKALGAVHRHQGNGISIFIIGIKVCNQGNFFQETGKGCVFPVLLRISLYGRNQLAQVFQPGLALFFLRFQHGFVSGLADHFTGKFIQRKGDGKITQFTVHGVKRVQRAGGTAQCGIRRSLPDDLHHRHAVGGGQFPDLINGGGTNLSCRFIDDAAQAHVVPRVDHNGHVRVDILDFLAVKEALATHNAVRDTGTGKISFDGVGLRIHAVQNGMVF